MQSGTPLSLLLMLVVGSLATVFIGSSWITDYWWFQSLDQAPVFITIETARWGALATAALVTYASMYGSLAWAIRNSRPQPVLRDLEDSPLQALAAAEPKLIARGIAVAVALVVGLTASELWDQILLAIHGGEFGYADPVFGRDAGFFVFQLPLIMALRSMAMGVVVLTTLATLVAYISRGGISARFTEVNGEVQTEGIDISEAARAHIGGLVATAMVLNAAGIFLARYDLASVQGPLIAGMSHTQANYTLPLLTLQAGLALVASWFAWRAVAHTDGRALIAAVALAVLPGFVVGGVSNMVQQFDVAPNELVRETPYIDHHIEATRLAYGLDIIEERTLAGENAIDASVLARNQPTIRNIRLWDHEPLLKTFAQLHEIRTYYEFADVDNDRYLVDGELRQIMLSPRELPTTSLNDEARTWVNERMTFTHGYGVALGPVNEVNEQGLPRLFVENVPPVVEHDVFRIDRPEIYYGETMDTEVFVNTYSEEFDYPSADGNVYTTYTGAGGVPVGTAGRALFALRLGSSEVLFSRDIHAESRILLYRSVRQRVQTLAPFLTLDPDPYMVIHEGRLVWMLDAYTTSTRFPYSAAARQDDEFRVPRGANYLRNSIKITIDAYDGEVHLYRMDNSDPIADAWMATMPELFEPLSDMPPGLQEHLRYPEHYFGIQSHLYALFHMTDPKVFYNREDLWEVPQAGGVRMKPYYTVMTLPGDTEAEFIVMQPFNPAEKPNLAAWLVASSDGERYGQIRAYTFPKEKVVYGAGQIVARINQDDSISEKLSLWNQQGSEVGNGTLLVIPIEESLLYIQPLYLRSKGGEAIPELKRVIVAYEDRIAMRPTLEESLDALFAETPAYVPPSDTADADTGEPEIVADRGETLAQAAERAAGLWEQAQQAAAAGDWSAHGQALDQLDDAIEQLAIRLHQPEAVPEGDTEEAEAP